MKLSDSHARKALAVLLAQRKLTAAQVVAAVRTHGRLVFQLQQRLAALEGGLVPARVGTSDHRPKRRSGRSRGRPAGTRISAERKAAMVRQGKYLAALRGLSAQKRARVKAVLTSKGWAAAIAAAQRMPR